MLFLFFSKMKLLPDWLLTMIQNFWWFSCSQVQNLSQTVVILLRCNLSWPANFIFHYVKRCVFLSKHRSSSKDSPYIAVFFSWKGKWYIIFCLREAYNLLFKSNNTINFNSSFSRDATLFLFESLTTTADQHCENISF